MKPSNSKNFVSMLSEELPVVCFFHKKSDDVQIKKIKEILLKVEKQLPLLPLYEFVTDENPDNERLSEVMEIASNPVIIIYKDGCFNRYKDKKFTELEITQFIGGKKIYMPKEEKKIELEADL